jgi:DNA polymerase elongation subunit (family B)
MGSLEGVLAVDNIQCDAAKRIVLENAYRTHRTPTTDMEDGHGVIAQEHHETMREVASGACEYRTCYIHLWEGVSRCDDIVGWGRTREGKSVSLRIEDYRSSVFVSFPDNGVWPTTDDEEEEEEEEWDKVRVRPRFTRLRDSRQIPIAVYRVWPRRHGMSALQEFVRAHGGTVMHARIPAVQQFMHDRGILPHGWVDVVVHANMSVSHWDVYPSTCTDPRPALSTLTFDIETYSSRHAFPNEYILEDEIRAISYVHVSPTGHMRRICCHVGPEVTVDGIDVRRCVDEYALLRAHFNILVECQPDVVITFNGYSYDYRYMHRRILLRMRAEDVQADWVFASNMFANVAYGTNKFFLVGRRGMVHVDVYQYCRHEMREPSWKLKELARRYLPASDHKDDLSYRAMNDIFTTRDPEGHRSVVRYCVQDSVACYQLFLKFHIWDFCIQIGNLTSTAVTDLYYRGSTHKLVNAMFAMCMKHWVLMQEGTGDKEEYTGAYVFDTAPGRYNVHVLDFKSLYPSIIVSRNLCYTTYIRTVNRRPPPSRAYHVIRVHERKYHIFSAEHEGLVPKILRQMISERDQIKKRLRADSQLSVEEKHACKMREKALKIVANSLYGCMGMSSPLISMTACAEATTAEGRNLLNRTRHIIETTYGCSVVYGDTDSCFVVAPAADTDMRGICAHISRTLRGDNGIIELEYEKQYHLMLLLSKKVYVGARSTVSPDISLYDLVDTLEFRGTPVVKMLYPSVVREHYSLVAAACLRDDDPTASVVEITARNIMRVWSVATRPEHAERQRAIVAAYRERHPTIKELPPWTDQSPFVCDVNYNRRIPGSSHYLQSFVLRVEEDERVVHVGSRVSYVVEYDPNVRTSKKADMMQLAGEHPVSHIHRKTYALQILASILPLAERVFPLMFEPITTEIAFVKSLCRIHGEL